MTMPLSRIGRGAVVVLLVVLGAGALLAGAHVLGDANVIRIGAVFPITSNAASLAGPELAGVQIAADAVNADGGIDGRRVVLEVRNLASRDAADAVMADLRDAGVQIVIGAYSSDLSIAASEAASRAGLVYWEAGAVADRLTGQGLPMVFRVGASGANLGANSANFAASELASRLGKRVADLRVAIAVADDTYANAVADAAASTAAARGMPVVLRRSYNLAVPDWPAVMADLRAARPDVIILASHIPDGIAFRQAMVAARLQVGALIGSTMAECDPDFAGELGADAIGIFASDRPTAGFQASALDAGAAATYARFATAWAAVHARSGGTGAGDGTGSGGTTGDGYGRGGYGYGESEYTIHGPDEDATAEENEEALAGFSAAWALFHHVLPATGGAFDAATVAAAARAVDLPEGSLPNGAGLRFSTDPARLGKNELAAAVIWQWQAVRTYEFVWPPSYATGSIAFVPLDR
jgi:branched-chain amino acid transport system substrate-binding protein